VLQWALSDEAKVHGLHIDPTRVAVMGNSAGGNLTAALSLLLSFTEGPNKRFRDGLPKSFQQRLQILLYPSVDVGVPYGDRFRRSTSEVQAQSLPIAVAELMEDSYLPPHIDRDQVLIRPLKADNALLSSLEPPAALVLTAGMDCLKQEADDYSKSLAEAGVKVVTHDYSLAKHGFSHYTKGQDFRPDDVEDCWNRIHSTLKSSMTSSTQNALS